MLHALEQGKAWLTNMRNPDGSLGYTPGQAGRGEPTILATGAGLDAPMAWLGEGKLGWAGRLAPTALRLQPATRLLREREIARLLAQRSEIGAGTGDFDTSLAAWGWVPGTTGWTEPTAHALLALRTDGRQGAVRRREAVEFLLDRQGADGGWNYGNPRMLGKDLDSAPVATAWALLALLGLPEADRACTRGISWLEDSVGALPTVHSLALLTLAQAAAGLQSDTTATTLLGRQQPNGAWRGRVDLTALACLAIAASLGEPCPLLLPTHPGGRP